MSIENILRPGYYSGKFKSGDYVEITTLCGVYGEVIKYSNLLQLYEVHKSSGQVVFLNESQLRMA